MVRRAEYRKLLTEAYDLDKPEAPADELAYYMRAIEEAEQPVLEVMAGSGRFLVPIAERGMDIDGTDASGDMLAACRAKCSERGLGPQLYEQAFHELGLPRRYGLIFLGGGSMGLVAGLDEVRAGLRGMYEHLLPGGRLLVEIEPPPVKPRGYGLWTGRWWTRPNGDRIVLRTLADYDSRTRIETGLGIYELYQNSSLVETEVNDWVRRFWEPDEFSEELTAAGFQDITITQAFSDAPPGGDERMLSVVCRKGG